jgi:hypothetical protein
MAKTNNNSRAENPQVVEWVEQPLLQRAKITSSGEILKGIDAQDAPFGSKDVWILCLNTVDIPLPSDKSADLAQNCVRQIPHPTLGHPINTFAISSSAGLAMLEMAHALARRDEKLEALREGLDEAGAAYDELAKNFAGLVARVKKLEEPASPRGESVGVDDGEAG